ncbi:MAG: hypothetical protein KGJ27_13355, partial [candidate division NC10 bacterium]|nr:hypothetical protein [candidate division NC10 bacterium]
MGVLAATPDRPDRQVKLPWDWEKMPRQVEPLKSITKGLWSIVSSAVTMPLRQRLEGGSTDILIAQEEAIELLARLYEFGDYIAVTTFLRQNPRLIGLLLEAHERI